jgi:hypothetical protein
MKKLFRSFLIGVILVSMSNWASASLLHRYSFNDGTANDSIGTANGMLMNGATIVGGELVLGGGAAATGAYVSLPASAIGINAYPGLTFELWSTQPTVNQGFSMTAVFGGTWADNGTGKSYVDIATTRGDDVSRGAIAITPDSDAPWGDEIGANGPEKNDATKHLYSLTVSSTQLAFYIDGVQVGATMPLGTASLSGLSTEFGYLGKGVYSGDATFNGTIDEFRMYDNALSASQIAANFAYGPNVIPEPSTFALFALGIVSLVFLRRRA